MAATWSVAAESILQAIGRTPLVRLKHVAGADAADVLVKLEYYNPTGSYKDRMALAMIEGAEARGALRPGMRVVEFTGGSTGSSLALVCAVKGYHFAPVSSDAFAKEKLDTMRAFGADLHMVDSEGGKITPGLFDRMRAEVKRMLQDPDSFGAEQFNNADAVTRTALDVVAALKLAKEMGAGKVVATVAVDTGLKYLAGDLFSEA